MKLKLNDYRDVHVMQRNIGIFKEVKLTDARRMISVDKCFVFFRLLFFCFVVAIRVCDAVEATHGLP